MKNVIPEFWNQFQKKDEISDFENALNFLKISIEKYFKVIKHLDEMEKKFLTTIISKLIPQNSPFVLQNCKEFQLINKILTIYFKKIMNCNEMLEEFETICSKLNFVGMLNICTPIFMKTIYEMIQQKLKQLCNDGFEEEKLPEIMEWYENVVIYWLNTFFSPNYFDKDELKFCKKKIEYFIFHTLANIRINELFNIIVLYPQSMGALKDLKECLMKTGLQNEMISSLKKS